MSVTRLIRKARKPHRCHQCDVPGKIQPGESYLTHTALRGDEFGYSDYGGGRTPHRYNECAECATRYGRAEMLAQAETIEAVPTGAASVIPTTEQDTK
jgi:hypothetical protein